MTAELCPLTCIKTRRSKLLCFYHKGVQLARELCSRLSRMHASTHSLFTGLHILELRCASRFFSLSPPPHISQSHRDIVCGTNISCDSPPYQCSSVLYPRLTFLNLTALRQPASQSSSTVTTRETRTTIHYSPVPPRTCMACSTQPPHPTTNNRCEPLLHWRIPLIFIMHPRAHRQMPSLCEICFLLLVPAASVASVASTTAATHSTTTSLAKCWKPGKQPKPGQHYTFDDTTDNDFDWCTCLDYNVYDDWAWEEYWPQDYMCHRCSHGVCQYHARSEYRGLADCQRDNPNSWCKWVTPSMKGYYGEVAAANCVCGYCECERTSRRHTTSTTTTTSSTSSTGDEYVVVKGRRLRGQSEE